MATQRNRKPAHNPTRLKVRTHGNPSNWLRPDYNYRVVFCHTFRSWLIDSRDVTIWVDVEDFTDSDQQRMRVALGNA